MQIDRLDDYLEAYKKDMESINYKYNEDKALAELSKYIDSTYDEHYSNCLLYTSPSPRDQA